MMEMITLKNDFPCTLEMLMFAKAAVAFESVCVCVWFSWFSHIFVVVVIVSVVAFLEGKLCQSHIFTVYFGQTNPLQCKHFATCRVLFRIFLL